jgi:hypothetical protein
MTLSSIVAIAVLAAAGAAHCEGDSCESRSDETSLMQVQRSVKSGSSRQPVQAGDISELAASTAVRDASHVVASAEPAACLDFGWHGYEPGKYGAACFGAVETCSDLSATVKGWRQGRCESGFEVQCEKCTPANAAPSPVTPTTTSVPPKAAVYVSSGKPDMTPPLAGTPVVKGYNAKNATETHVILESSLDTKEELMENLTKARDTIHEVQKNISKAHHDEAEYLAQARKDREAAVKFAETEALANQSKIRAENQMAEAEAGLATASASALHNKALAQNANMDMINAKKTLVDVQAEYQYAMDALHQGSVDVTKASNQYTLAKSNEHVHNGLRNAQIHLDSFQGHIEQKHDQKMEVKDAMENAYIASTAGANESSSPSYGESTLNADEALGPYDVPKPE